MGQVLFLRAGGIFVFHTWDLCGSDTAGIGWNHFHADDSCITGMDSGIAAASTFGLDRGTMDCDLHKIVPQYGGICCKRFDTVFGRCTALSHILGHRIVDTDCPVFAVFDTTGPVDLNKLKLRRKRR